MNSSPRIRAQRYQMIQTVLLSVYSLVLLGMHFIRIFDNSFWGGSGAVRTNLPSEQSSSFSASPDEGDDPKFFRHSKCTVRTLGSNVTIQMVGSVFVLYCEIPTRQ